MTQKTVVAFAFCFLIAGTSVAQENPEVLPPHRPMEAPLAPMPPLANDTPPDLGPASHLWVSMDALLGWFQPAHLPPLVTTSRPGTPRASAGVLGQPNTSVLFDGKVNDDIRSGIQAGIGGWLDSERIWGWELSFSVLESQSTFFATSSSGTPILARPFTNAVTGVPASVVIAFPGSSSGSVAARDSSGNFYETHFDMTERICGNDRLRLDAIAGYRFFRYDEGLRVQQTTMPTGGAIVSGTQIAATDSFVSKNEFNGFDLGLRAGYRDGPWSIDFLSKLATGGLFGEVKIRGSTTTTVPGVAPVTRTGGILALSSNIGNHRMEEWTVFPEFGANVAWYITPRLQMHLGYSFLFLADVLRAHDQVNLTINPGLFPPMAPAAGSPNQPSFQFTKGDLWIQTIHLGLEYAF
jgi:Putative beta barrel porin-7 (BBP7)